MGTNTKVLLILLFIFIVCLSHNGVYAFGAGNIPSFAYMEGRAFRHGDIEDVLEEIAKKSGGFALGAIIGKGGSKFGGLDIKRVYFGNWLRDYSQAIDVAGLKRLPFQTLMNLIMVLGFLANGYATNEFEVTPERLGCYLCTEHIDNPKGYPDDAQKYDPRLHGPVDPRELEIDPRTGMKNYIANENGHWDTSKGLVRRTLERCIQIGRQHRAQGQKQDEYEAYRLLGQLLHTLEDFAAHSNFCELALVNMGCNDVFVHVGDQVRIQAPNGRWVAPIVTGTFGSDDFYHSIIGEANDHIAQASVTDLNAELEKARAKSATTTRSGGGSPADSLRQLFFSIPGGGGNEMAREMENIERMRADPSQGGKPPEQMSPQELHSVLWQVLSFRDSVAKKIEKTIEKIPGLGPLIEKLMESISVFVFTTLEPFLKPLMKSATSGLTAISGEVINSRDQYEVFNDPRASDPTHSFLSKDHFNLILNEPAGNLAKIIVQHTVPLVVQAWDNSSTNIHQVTEDILSCMFHPDFHNPNSKVQREMLDYMRQWIQGLGGKQQSILQRLSKESVRNHQNIRLAGEGGMPAAQGSHAQNLGIQTQHDVQGYLSGVPGVGPAVGLLGKLSGPSGGSSSSHGGGGSGFGNLGGMAGEAQSFLNQFTGGAGGRKDAGAPSGYSGAGYEPTSHSSASSYPGSPHSSGTPSFPGSPSGPPSHRPHSHHHGAPPSPAFPGGSSYDPPVTSPPHSSHAPSFPGAPAPTAHSGYNPSYQPSYSSPASSYPGGPSYNPQPPGGLSFPGGPSPGFPGGPSPGGPGGFGFPGGPPPPGGPGFPGGIVPEFPDTGPGYGGGPPSFPQGPGYGAPPDRPFGW